MLLKSKYNLEEEVWVMFHDKPHKMAINTVCIECNKNGIINVKYNVGPIDVSLSYCEDKLFKSKEELLKSL